MPYTSEKRGGKITVKKKDTGAVVGHTTPDKYADYMAALHMAEPKGYAFGGDVEEDMQDPDLTAYGLPATPPNPSLPPPPAPATPTPEQPSATPTVGGTNPILTPENRAQLYSALEAKRRGPGALIGDALAGFGDALNVQAGNGSPGFLNKTMAAQKENEARTLGQFDLKRQQDIQQNQLNIAKMAQDPTSDYSRTRQKSAAPILKSAGYTDEDIKNIPASQIDDVTKNAKDFADAKMRAAALKAAAQARADAVKGTKDLNLGLREDQQQDRLEQQARQSVTSLRGDKSLQDAEAKRDASTTVYNTIKEIKAEGRMPSKMEYYDILGQMWKARTGASPTDQAIKDLDAHTFKGDLAKVATYFSGQPVGATTGSVLDNIQGFAKSSGLQADALHEGYMRTHLIKPHGLSEERWQPIVTTGRGKSFREATGLDEKEAAQPGGIPALPSVASQADYDKLPSGSEYLDAKGTHRRKK